MTELTLDLKVGIYELADMVAQSPTDQLIEFIASLDEHVADSKFTVGLIRRLGVSMAGNEDQQFARDAARILDGLAEAADEREQKLATVPLSEPADMDHLTVGHTYHLLSETGDMQLWQSHEGRTACIKKGQSPTDPGVVWY